MTKSGRAADARGAERSAGTADGADAGTSATTAAIAEAARLPGLRVVVMGVSGSGKSTVGELLAERLGVDYADADDFHSEANRAKMSAGIPLTDDDRLPWLDSIGDWMAGNQQGAVVTCSALKRSYRDLLRRYVPAACFLHLAGSEELIYKRMAARHGHFMAPSLLRSQFETLEPPGADERAITADAVDSPDQIVTGFIVEVNRWAEPT